MPRSGAWPHEREHGIGYSNGYGHNRRNYHEYTYSRARREANRMRSEAYWSGIQALWEHEDEYEIGDFKAAQNAYAPGSA